MKVIKHEVHETHFSVLIEDKKIKVWVDVSVEDKDLSIDWNKYIFHLDNEEDVKVKQYQEDCDNADACFSLATSYLEENKLIYQNNKGNWYLHPTKEELYNALEEYKTCNKCCYDIKDDNGEIMEHECIND